MKIIFMGTPALAVLPLEKLLASEHEVLAVVTQPDRASGRGRTVSFSPVKQCALEHGLTVLQPESIGEKEVLDHLEQMRADLFVVVAYAQKLPERLLEMAPYGCINLHPSLLPKYRGSAPFRGPILNGDAETGVTVMKLVEKWDAGDILLQERFPVEKKDNAVSLEEKAVPLGAELLLSAVNGLENGTIIPVPQNDSEATYLRQIRKEEGKIDFQKSAVEIERQIRACIPWPSAYTALEGKMFKIWDADVVFVPENKTQPDYVCPHHAQCHGKADRREEKLPTGAVVRSTKDMLIVKCGSGCLKLNEVQLEGKKRMRTEEFLKGNRIETGTVLGI